LSYLVLVSANLEREESSLEACGEIGTIGVTLGAHPTPIGIGSTSEASPLGFFKLFLASAHTIFRSRTQIGDQLLIERYECSYQFGQDKPGTVQGSQARLIRLLAKARTLEREKELDVDLRWISRGRNLAGKLLERSK
jgi:hypothetical protein